MAGPGLTSHNHVYDANLLFKDAGLVAASAAAQVSAVNKIVDLGASLPSTNQPVAEVIGEMVIDVTAIETASNDETYTIIVQGSNSSTFASGIENLCQMQLSAAAVALGGATVAGATGRHLLPFRNWKNNTVYRYLRVYTVVGGTVATGINYTAYAGMLK